METMHWVLVVLLAISLAASTGLNTFLPLFMVALADHYNFGRVTLLGEFDWLASEQALWVLGFATLFEVVADKFPAVDHLLDSAGFVVRPLAGALATASVFTGADPMVAAMAGLAIGAPTTLGFHSAKAATRVTSSVGTLGCANPLLSLLEDIAALFMVLIGIFVPILVPVVMVIAIYSLCKLVKAARARKTIPTTPIPSEW